MLSAMRVVGMPVLEQLPRGEPRPLEPGSGLVGEDGLHLAEANGGADDAEGGAVAGGGEGPGVAVGEDARLGRQQFGAEVPHEAAGLEVLLLDGEGLLEEPEAQRVGPGGLQRVEAPPHPLDGPEQVHGGGARGGEGRAHVGPLAPERRPLAAGRARAEGEAEGRRDPDRGGAADRHVLDRGRDLVVGAAAQEDLLVGKTPLVDHHHDPVLPRHRRDHPHLREPHRSPGAITRGDRGNRCTGPTGSTLGCSLAAWCTASSSPAKREGTLPSSTPTGRLRFAIPCCANSRTSRRSRRGTADAFARMPWRRGACGPENSGCTMTLPSIRRSW